MMKLLLDTHAWLWWLSDDRALGSSARRAIADRRNVVAVSAASVWEVTIKRARGRLGFEGDPAGAVLDGGFEPRPISLAHAGAAGDLPPHHRDPFDRMLAAQAVAEGLTLVTHDPVFGRYDVPVLPA
jgi:PIN domain nuclease of toxin-antitoxin system